MQAYDDLKHFETPYVVKLHRFTPLAETQEVFTFHHPNGGASIDNSRSCFLIFERQQQPSAICHGFAGYFDAELYKKVNFLLCDAGKQQFATKRVGRIQDRASGLLRKTGIWWSISRTFRIRTMHTQEANSRMAEVCSSSLRRLSEDA
jgi:hypothetical protein